MLSFPGSPGERKAYWASLAAVVAIHLAVLWIPAYNTLVDYPSHLGRAWALHAYAGTPFFQAIFVRILDPVPNLAIDLIVPPLLNLFTPIVAGKLFLSLIVLLFALGCHWLAVAMYGKPSWMAPLAVFAVYNSTFLFGLVNSLFSLSLFLVTMAAWLSYRRPWGVLRWLAVAALATATYIAHLSGFVFLALAISIWKLADLRDHRRIRLVDLVDLSVLVPAVLIQLYPWANKVQVGSQIEWGRLVTKLLALASVFVGFSYGLDLLTILLLAAAIAIVAVTGQVRPARMPLLLAVAFLITSVVCPTRLASGGGAAADARFVPPAIVFLFLSFNATSPRGAGKLALAIAFAAMLLRLGEVGWALNRISSAAELQVAALAKAAPNTRIYNLFLKPVDRQTQKRARGNLHVASYSLILTQSVSSDFFGVRGAQPLCFRNPEEWIAEASPDSFQPAYLDTHLRPFDYVWGCNLDQPHREYIERRGSLVSTGDICALWKLRK